LQPFSAQGVLELGEAGGVAARPRQARDVAGADRVDALHEHDRDVAARLLNLRHDRRCTSAGHNDVGREREQFRRRPAQARAIARGPAGVDLQVLAGGPPRLLQPLHERDEAQL
jgi:hypothetical protein